MARLEATADNDERIARQAHGIRQSRAEEGAPFITDAMLERFAVQPLPDVTEQVNLLILWVGLHTLPGSPLEISPLTHTFVIGARTDDGYRFVVNHLFRIGWLEGNRFGTGRALAALTFEGWDRFGMLRHGIGASRKAFVAMQFGNAELDSAIDEAFRPAVAQTGFTLTRLDDEPRAGLIDDRLRVEIRASRFLIAELTHRNPGAYWEAGFAEGLGKPVIYLCRKDVFESGTHFDTNHHLTVAWDPANLADAASKLKATIRATLPEESKLSD